MREFKDSNTEIEGLGELFNTFQELETITAAKATRKTLRKASKPLHEEIIKRAPEDVDRDVDDKERLKNNIKMSAKTGKGKNVAEVTITVKSPYAIHNEFGTSRQKENPFIRGSVDDLGDSVASDFIQELKKEIEKLGK